MPIVLIMAGFQYTENQFTFIVLMFLAKDLSSQIWFLLFLGILHHTHEAERMLLFVLIIKTPENCEN